MKGTKNMKIQKIETSRFNDIKHNSLNKRQSNNNQNKKDKNENILFEHIYKNGIEKIR